MNRLIKKTSKLNIFWLDTHELSHLLEGLAVSKAVAIIKVYLLLILEADHQNRSARLSTQDIERDTKLTSERVQQAIKFLIKKEWIYCYQSISSKTLFFINDQDTKNASFVEQSCWLHIENSIFMELIKVGSNARMTTIEQILQAIGDAYQRKYAALPSRYQFTLPSKWLNSSQHIVRQATKPSIKRGMDALYQRKLEQDIRDKWLNGL